MDSAIDIECNFDVEQDGSYFFTWAWTYVGAQFRSDVYEELIVMRPDGWILGGQKKEGHLVEPGQTYLGESTRGGGRLIPGANHWVLKVFGDGGELLGEGIGIINAEISPLDT
jgi:hypothetical protein